MKNRKKLLASLLALAMSLYLLPTVWAEDLQQLQDIPENSYAESVNTDLPQEDEDTDTDNADTDILLEDEDTDNECKSNGIELMSLLPIDTEYIDVLIDRTNGVPPELADKPKYSFFVKEALSDLLIENGIISNSEAYEGNIVYSFNDNTYTSVGWNDVITFNSEDVYSVSTTEYGYVQFDYIYFILDGDQLNAENIRYRMCVYIKYFDESFVENANPKVFNKSGEEIRCFGSGHVSALSNETGKYFYSSHIVSSKSLEENEYPRFLITLPEGYTAANVEIYEGLIYDETGLGSSKNVTSQVIYDGTKKEPYEMEHYNYPDNYNGSKNSYKDLTFVITNEDGSKQYLPVEYYIYVNSNHVSLGTSTSPYLGSNYIALYSSPNRNDYLGYAYIYKVGATDNVTISAYAHYYDYIDENSNGVGDMDVSKISFACFGKYASMAAAVQNGATNIKDKLFSYSYAPVDLSKCKDITAYEYDGTEVQVKAIEVTVVDKYGIVHNETEYVGFVEKQASTESEPSDDTYFSIIRALKTDDDGDKEYLNYYKMTSDKDSYFKNGYQTLFILDDGNPVADSIIYPVFSKGHGVNIYADGYNGVQTSGESAIDFESGKAIQYAAASESGTKLKNYWVTFVTQQSGAKLFVNAVNDPSHFSANDKPQREIFLTPKNSYKHDIFFANIGDEELTGINVALSADVQGVKLDDYWTVIDSSVKKLAAFTKTSAPDNIAKIRLVPVDEDYFGDISGTLSITTANGGSVDIELTGIAGIPKITTDTLYDGVKYVPYSSVIMTNSMYGGNSMSFSVSGGKLPDGLVLRPNGEIYGIPTKVGAFTFTVKAVYNGATQEDGSEYSGTRTYTIVIADNTDDNVDAVNGDEQGYALTDRVSKLIKVYYNGMNGGNPIVDRIEVDSDLFRSEGSYTDEFMEFYIDGNKLAEGSDYTAEEGSTKITVRAQTFGHIGMTDSDVPHTLAAEFRTEGKTKDLKRSAQNVYLEYINTGKEDDVTDDIHGGNQGGGSSGNGNSGSANTNNTKTETDTGSVTAVMSIVDTEGNPISGLSIELHSSPKYAKTDSSGSVKFDSVEFGRHTLYIKDASSNKKVSQKFSIVSGSNIGMKGNVITAAAGGTVSLTIEYDGSKIKILSAAEDVSSAAGVYGDGKMLLMDISKNVLSKRTLYLILLFSAIIIALALKRKIKS